MKELLQVDVLGSFVDNRFLRGKADQEHLNCVTQKPWKKLSFAKTVEIEEAIHSASNAFLKWKHTTAYERARLLRLAGEMLLAREYSLS